MLTALLSLELPADAIKILSIYAALNLVHNAYAWQAKSTFKRIRILFSGTILPRNEEQAFLCIHDLDCDAHMLVWQESCRKMRTKTCLYTCAVLGLMCPTRAWPMK